MIREVYSIQRERQRDKPSDGSVVGWASEKERIPKMQAAHKTKTKACEITPEMNLCFLCPIGHWNLWKVENPDRKERHNIGLSHHL